MDDTTDLGPRRQVVAFIAIAAAALALLIAGIEIRHGAFKKTADISFLTDSASGINEGMSVKLLGFRIGSVSRITLEPGNQVRVAMRVAEEHMRHLHPGASARLIKEDVLGSSIIDIAPGAGNAALPGPDPLIAFARGRSLTQVAEELSGRAAPILDDVRALTGLLLDQEKGLQASLSNVRVATREIALAASEARGRVAIAGRGVDRILEDAHRAALNAGAAAAEAERGLRLAREALPDALLKLSVSLDNVQAAAQDGRKVAAAAVVTMPAAMQDALPLLHDSREIVRGVRNAWPLRNLVAPENTITLPLDSFDADSTNQP